MKTGSVGRQWDTHGSPRGKPHTCSERERDIIYIYICIHTHIYIYIRITPIYLIIRSCILRYATWYAMVDTMGYMVVYSVNLSASVSHKSFPGPQELG